MYEKKRILLVEDEILIAMGKQQELEKYGYTVEHINTGEKAVKLSKENNDIDLILMDIDLGKGIDGTEAAELILENKNIPIVFLSSHTEPEVVEKTRKITSYGYVVKNSNITVLDASINMAFKLFEAHEKIIDREELLQKTIDGVKDPILMIGSDYKILSSNTAARNQYNLDKEYCFQVSHNRETPCDGMDHPCILKQVVENNQISKVVHTHFNNRNEERLFELTATPLLDSENKLLGIIETSYDITEKRIFENKLKKSFNLLKYIIQHANSGIAVHDRNMNYLFVSENYLKIYNVKEMDVIGKNHYDVFPDLPQKWRDVHQKALNGEISSAESDPYPREDGSIDWTNWECRPWYEDNDSIGGVIVYTSVITAHKNLEAIADESTSSLNSLINNRKESIWSIDRNYSYIIFNDFFKEAYYSVYNVELKSGMNALNILPSEQIEFWKSKYERVLSGESVVFNHSSLIDNKLHFYEVSLNPIITNKEITGVTALSIDITERKQTKDMMVRNGIRFNELFQNMSSAVAVYNAVEEGNDFVFIDFNKAAEKLEKLSKENIIGRKVTEIFPGVWDLEILNVFKRVWKTGISEHCPVFQYKEGRIGGWRDNFVYKLPSGELVAIYDDITERKQLEDEVKQQLLEKEIILKETHHRIKNNFATVISLLSLQANSENNPVVLTALQDSIGRVDSMKVLYEKLLLTEDYQTSSVKEYLDNLIDDIQCLFPENIKLVLKKDIDDFSLDPKHLIPIGIIVNEILTNITKYAFIDRPSGIIEISLEEHKGSVKLSVCDNGIGLPEGFDIEKQEGFGIMLIKMLTEQLNGNISISSQNGTCVVIKFSI